MNMKKVKFLALMFLAGTTLFTSCKKDEETVADPTISFQGGTTSLVFTGTNSIDVNVTFAAEGKIESVSLNGPSLTGTGTTTTDITSKMGTTHTDNGRNQTSVIYLFQVTSADLALAFANHTTLTYTFTVNDQQPVSTTGTFTVTLQSTGTPFGAFTPNTGIILGGSSHPTLGSFYASSTNTVYLQAAAKTNATVVDFAYFYGTTNQATLVAPADADASTMFTGTSGVSTWTTKNSTKFVKLTGFDFAGLSATTDIADVTFGTLTKANTLAVGDVVAFKTVANKIGFAKVTACTNTDDGTITFDVKVQQ